MNNISSSQLLVWVQNHWFLCILLAIWSLFWVGLAFWHSARRGHVGWFLLFLIVHTLGILEIIYLFGVLKLKFGELFENR